MANFNEFNEGKVIVDLDRVVLATPNGDNKTTLRLDVNDDPFLVVDRSFEEIKKLLNVKVKVISRISQ